MSKLKVAVVMSNISPVPAVRGGATENMMTHLIEINEKNNKMKLTFFSPYDKEAEIEAKKYKNTKILFYPGNRIWDWLCCLPYRFLRKVTNGKTYLKTNFIKWCIKNIHHNDYDVVVVEGNYFQILQLKKAINVPIILHMHIDGLNIKTDNGKNIVDSCAGIFAISDYCKNRIVEIDSNQAGKVYVLKNMIDTSLFSPDGVDKIDFKKNFLKKYGIRNEKKVIVYCGRVTEVKGVKELIEAFLKLDDPESFLFIIGSSVYKDGSKTKYYRELEKMAGNRRNIVFLGYIDQKELPKYYCCAAISVVPSKWQEAAGNVIPESLACGVPVIASRRGGIPEYADERACILVDCDEKFVDNLKDALAKMTTDEKLYSGKKAVTRSIAIQYDKHNYYTHFYDLITEVLKG